MIYRYELWTFEFGHNKAWPLNKNLMPRKRAGIAFWEMLDRFCFEKNKLQYALSD